MYRKQSARKRGHSSACNLKAFQTVQVYPVHALWARWIMLNRYFVVFIYISPIAIWHPIIIIIIFLFSWSDDIMMLCQHSADWTIKSLKSDSILETALSGPSSGIHGKMWTHILHNCVEVDVWFGFSSNLLPFHYLEGRDDFFSILPGATLCVKANVSAGLLGVGSSFCQELTIV